MGVIITKLIAFFNAIIMVLTMISGFIWRDKDIVILYTNDVHCGIDENIGYAGLAAYKKDMQKETPYVSLVDCGDAIQGDTIGTVSKGEYIVDIMNEVGYDFAVLGNHEFDFGMDQLSYLIDKSDAQYLCANVSYTGSDKSALSDVAQYEIVNYGLTSVAFIGVATPNTITSSTPAYFMDENGDIVYDFFRGNNGETFYDCIQKNIDECKSKGADYVVVCSHLGESETFSPYSSVELAENTSGIDVVLDAHAHSTIPELVEQDKDGNDVIISSTGTKLQNIGQLVISSNGEINTELVSNYDKKDAAAEKYINGVKDSYEAAVNKVVAFSDTTMSVYNDEGIRIVRNRETSIGNFCADAYRAIAGSDIAFVNGGGIRADIKAGDITFADIIAVHPFGNTLCSVKATGQEVVDALEMASQSTEDHVNEGDYWIGENGGFLQVSGVKYTINTSVPSSVVVDDKGMFVRVEGERRVSDVMVQNKDGSYSPIDLNKEYTVASHNYIIKNSGNGINMFADNELIIDEGMTDYEMLINYITGNLNGKLGSKYSGTEGRITVK